MDIMPSKKIIDIGKDLLYNGISIQQGKENVF